MDAKQNIPNVFIQIQAKFTRLYTGILNCYELTLPQYALLSVLALAEVPLTMTEVSSKLYISKPAVTSLVDRLEKNEMIVRQNDPNDRRVNLLKLKPKGEKTVQEIRSIIIGDLMVKTLEQFNQAEKKNVEDFFQNLSCNLDAMFLRYQEGKES